MKHWFIILIVFTGLFSSCNNHDNSDKKIITQLKKQIKVFAEYDASFISKINKEKLQMSGLNQYAVLAVRLDNKFKSFADTAHCITDTLLLKTETEKFIAAYNNIIDSAIHSKTRRYKLFLDKDTSSLKIHPLLIEFFYGKSPEVNYYLLIEQAYYSHLNVLKIITNVGGYPVCNWGWQDNVGKLITITEKENSCVIKLQALLDDHFKASRLVSLEKKFETKEELVSAKINDNIISIETNKLSPGQYKATIEYSAIIPTGEKQTYPFDFFFTIK